VSVRAGGRTFTADAAVVAVPPTLVASGRLRFDPPLPDAKVAAAGAVPLGGVVRVIATLTEPAPSGGSLVAVGDEGGFWRVTPGESLLTVWIGGPSAARFSGMDPVDIALRASVAFPWLEPSRIADVRSADWGADPFTLGGYSYPSAGALDAPYAWAEPLDGTLFFCGEGTCGDVHPATVHGAMESGLRAAREVAGAVGSA
jgi:monoamine oxidase